MSMKRTIVLASGLALLALPGAGYATDNPDATEPGTRAESQRGTGGPTTMQGRSGQHGAGQQGTGDTTRTARPGTDGQGMGGTHGGTQAGTPPASGGQTGAGHVPGPGTGTGTGTGTPATGGGTGAGR